MRYGLVVLMLTVILASLAVVGCGPNKNPSAETAGGRALTPGPSNEIRPELSGSTGATLNYGAKDLPPEMPKDFNFTLKFGCGSWDRGSGPRNMLDTFKEAFTKDMVTSANVTTRLKLSKDEMAGIYKEMAGIKIMGYPTHFTPKSNMAQFPSEAFYLKIQVDGRIKEIFWDDHNVSQSREAVELRALINKIIRIIESKKEYRRLPEATGGYG